MTCVFREPKNAANNCIFADPTQITQFEVGGGSSRKRQQVIERYLKRRDNQTAKERELELQALAIIAVQEVDDE